MRMIDGQAPMTEWDMPPPPPLPPGFFFYKLFFVFFFQLWYWIQVYSLHYQNNQIFEFLAQEVCYEYIVGWFVCVCVCVRHREWSSVMNWDVNWLLDVQSENIQMQNHSS